MHSFVLPRGEFHSHCLGQSKAIVDQRISLNALAVLVPLVEYPNVAPMPDHISDDGEHLLFPSEIIASIFTFIPWGSSSNGNVAQNTLMNILLAVGPTDANACRVAYLKDNDAGFEYVLETCREIAYIGRAGDVAARKKKRKLSKNIRAWMRVNPNWRNLCCSEGVEEFALASRIDEEGDLAFRVNPFVFFNNPAVAIECGLLDVLKCLVEDVGVDINSMMWSSLSSYRRVHLLSEAMVEDQWGCFKYLMGLPKIDPNSQASIIDDASFEDGEESRDVNLVQYALEKDCIRPRYLKALLDQPDCEDINSLYAQEENDEITPLIDSLMNLYAYAGVGRSSRVKFAKMKQLLESGADPVQQGCIDIAQSWIERLRSMEEGETSSLISPKDIPTKISVLKAAISTMEEYIFGKEGGSWEFLQEKM